MKTGANINAQKDFVLIARYSEPILPFMLIRFRFALFLCKTSQNIKGEATKSASIKKAGIVEAPCVAMSETVVQAATPNFRFDCNKYLKKLL